jgi:hypothetical protein
MLDKIFPKLLLLTFTGATIGTSTMAGLKVASDWNSGSVKENSAISIDVSATATPEPERENLVVKSPTPTQEPKPTTPQLADSNSCLVTLFGQQFDVAPLMNTHSGGNIFVCNTDMTATYQKEHGTDLSRMSQFRIGASSTVKSSLDLKLFSDDDNDKENDDREKKDEFEDDD